MDTGLLSLLNQTVQIAPSTGLDGNGMETYGTPVPIPALIFEHQKLVSGPQATTVVSTTQVYVNGPTDVTTSSKITLPNGTSPLILAVSAFPDEHGNIDYKIVYT
jgi:hypothetical protein